MENNYTLLYEFMDGRTPFVKKDFGQKSAADNSAALDKVCGGYKRVTVAKEQYWEVESKGGDVCCSYGFLTEAGELFQCVATSLGDCRAKRDRWLALPDPRPQGIRGCTVV